MQSRKPNAPRPDSTGKRERFTDLLPDGMHVRSFWGRALTIGTALGLMLAGFLSSLIPVIPGFILVGIGVILLGTTSRTLRGLINAADRRCPPGLRRRSRQCQRSARKTRIAFQRARRRLSPPRRTITAPPARTLPKLRRKRT
ncbi:MAG: hypothetical protein R6W89_05240 [Candidatus Hydrogenedentota bacterium]